MVGALRADEARNVSLFRTSTISHTMRILVLGGTGPCGQLLIQEVLAVGHAVVVFARSPGKLGEDIRTNPAVTIVEAQLTDRDALSQALSGVDAVLSALGPAVMKGPLHSSNTPLAHAYSLLLEVMEAKGVHRLIALGTPSMKDEHDKFSLTFKLLVSGVGLFAHSAYKDVVAIGETIRAAHDGLAWTIARVPILTDDPSKETVAGYIGDGKVKARLSRPGFAAFCVKQLTSEEWVKKAPLVSSP